MITLEQLNKRGTGFLPGLLGIVITKFGPGEMCAELAVTPQLMAPNGYLHAGTFGHKTSEFDSIHYNLCVAYRSKTINYPDR